MSDSTPTNRWLPVFNTTIVRVYKGVGLFALTAILLGLLGFLTVNVFYLFDRSWIRPVILSPSHERVVDMNSNLAKAKQQRDQLIGQRRDLQVQIGATERTIASNVAFEKEFAGAVQSGGSKSYEALLARRKYDEVVLQRQEAAERRESILHEIEMVERGIARYERVVAQIEGSPFLAAMDGPVTVAFVPYANLENASKGEQIYACSVGLVWCSRVGSVLSIIEGEVTNSHPQNGKSVRGVMLEIELTDKEAGEDSVLFVGGKPFWIL